MKKKFLITLLVFGATFLPACGNSSATKETVSATQASDEVSTDEPATTEDILDSEGEFSESDIDVNAVPMLNGGVCVFITNNSSVIVDELEVEILYKGDDGNTIDVDNDGHDMILPGQTVVSGMRAPENYKDFTINTAPEIGVHSSYENHLKNIDAKCSQGSDGIIVEITNNGDVKIDEVEYVIVYYKDGDIVATSYATDIYDLDPGKTATEKEYCLDEYNDFKLYINQAHTFGLR